MASQHKIVLVYDAETREAIEVGFNVVDFNEWSKATDERRDRTVRRQVVKQREKMMEIAAKAINDLKRMRAEPSEISDLLFYIGLRMHQQAALDAIGDDAPEQEDEIGN